MEGVIEDLWDGSVEDLDRLRLRISVHSNLESLEKLCLQNISDNIEKYCALEEPFASLPPVLLTSLQNVLRDEDKLERCNVMPCIVGENTEYLSLDMQRLSLTYAHLPEVSHPPHLVKNLLARIGEKGKASLQGLHLRFPSSSSPECCSQPGVRDLSGMLSQLASLRSLSLHNCSVPDTLLSVIGATCPHLRCLIFGESVMTNDGLFDLCNGHLPYGRCINLTHLNLEQCKNITVSGLVTLILTLPKLLVIKHNLVYDALHEIIRVNGPREFQLICINIQFSTKHINEIKIINDILPNLEKLQIDTTNIEIPEISNFFNLKNLNSIEINKSNNLSSVNLELLFIHYGNNLVKIKILFHDNPIDISIIAFNCLNIKEFIFQSESSRECKYKLQSGLHFRNLVKCELIYSVPEDILKCMLSSSFLEDLVIRFDISNNLILWLLSQARSNQHIFSNLRRLLLETDVSPENIKILISIAPKLNKLFIDRDYWDDLYQFKLLNRLRYQIKPDPEELFNIEDIVFL